MEGKIRDLAPSRLQQTGNGGLKFEICVLQNQRNLFELILSYFSISIDMSSNFSKNRDKLQQDSLCFYDKQYPAVCRLLFAVLRKRDVKSPHYCAARAECTCIAHSHLYNSPGRYYNINIPHRIISSLFRSNIVAG